MPINIKDFVDILSSIVTVIATILAGAWAYFHFVKGRVFNPRLTLTISARQLQMRGETYVVSTLQLSNVGLSMVKIREGKLIFDNPDARDANITKSFDRVVDKVLLRHTRIEPGAVIKEECIRRLPADHCSPVKVVFRVVDAGGSEFTATAIAVQSDK